MNRNLNKDKSKKTKGDGVSFLIRFVAMGLLLFLFPLLYTEYSLNNKKDVSSSVSVESMEASLARIDFARVAIFDGSGGGDPGDGVAKPLPYVDIEKYNRSISPIKLCYLTAEAYTVQSGLVYKLIKNYMEINNNKAEGWTHIKEGIGGNGFSWTLWQNQYDKNAYALVFTGTDQIQDTLEYIPMMTNENYCTQMDETIDIAKQIKNFAPTAINKLHITGHSLGGYLAAYLASDIVDKDLGSSPYSRISAKDIHENLKVSAIRCTTFAAPGFYEGNMKWPVINKVQSITAWGQFKKNMHAKGAYNSYIMNYSNQLDPVSNLFIKPENFKALGKVKQFTVARIELGRTLKFTKKILNIPFIKNSVVGSSLNSVSDIDYHLPHVYINALS